MISGYDMGLIIGMGAWWAHYLYAVGFVMGFFSKNRLV